MADYCHLQYDGPPAPPSAETRTDYVRVRLTPGERALLVARANAEARTLSDYIRSRCLS